MEIPKWVMDLVPEDGNKHDVECSKNLWGESFRIDGVDARLLVPAPLHEGELDDYLRRIGAK